MQWKGSTCFWVKGSLVVASGLQGAEWAGEKEVPHPASSKVGECPGNAAPTDMSHSSIYDFIPASPPQRSDPPPGEVFRGKFHLGGAQKAAARNEAKTRKPVLQWDHLGFSPLTTQQNLASLPHRLLGEAWLTSSVRHCCVPNCTRQINL